MLVWGSGYVTDEALQIKVRAAEAQQPTPFFAVQANIM